MNQCPLSTYEQLIFDLWQADTAAADGQLLLPQADNVNFYPGSNNSVTSLNLKSMSDCRKLT
jgi:hypothetical protein